MPDPFPDPYSIGFAVAGAVVGLLDSEKRQDWEAGASTKLDQILANEQLIINDLKQLQVAVIEEIDGQFVAAEAARLQGYIALYQQVIPDIVNFASLNSTDAKWVTLVDNTNALFTQTFTLVEYGPAAYQSVFAGVLALRGTYLLGYRADFVNSGFYKDISSQYSKWLDTSTAGYPGQVRQFRLLQQQGNLNEANKIIANIPIEDWDWTDDNGNQSTVQVTLHVSGSIANGYTCAYSVSDGPLTGLMIEGWSQRRTDTEDNLNLYSQEWVRLDGNVKRLDAVLFQMETFQNCVDKWKAEPETPLRNRAL